MSNNQDYYSIDEVTRMPIKEIEEFLSLQGRTNGTEESDLQLRLSALRLLDQEGYLSPRDSSILNIPYFDKIYVQEHGNLFSSLVHLGINISPLSEIGTLVHASHILTDPFFNGDSDNDQYNDDKYNSNQYNEED